MFCSGVWLAVLNQHGFDPVGWHDLLLLPTSVTHRCHQNQNHVQPGLYSRANRCHSQGLTQQPLAASLGMAEIVDQWFEMLVSH